MNRKQRRKVAREQRSGSPITPADRIVQDTPSSMFNQAKGLLRAGRLVEAERICRQLISVNPENGHALHLLGAVAGQAGNLEAALDLFRRSADRLPAEPAVHLDLGSALQGRGCFNEALEAFQLALQLRPQFLPAQMGVGNALRALSRFEEAAQAYRTVTQRSPKSAEAWANLGIVLKELEQPDQAIEAFQKAIALNPQLAEAHSALGILLWRQGGRTDVALASLRQALAVRPDYADVHAIIGHLLLQQERGVEAEAPFRKLIQIRPNDARAHEGLGQALDIQGRNQEAEAAFRTALELNPTREALHKRLVDSVARQDRMDDAHAACTAALTHEVPPAQVYTWRGELYLEEGNQEQAILMARKAAELDPEGIAGLLLMARIKRVGVEDDLITKLESFAAQAEFISPDQAILVEYALAKAYRDVDDHDRSFSYLASASSRKSKMLRFDTDKASRGLRSIADAHPPELFDRFANVGDPSDLPIFIVGMPRSGTTLTEQVLASHPEIHGAGELKDLSIALGTLDRADRPPLSYAETINALTPGLCREIGQKYVQLLRGHGPHSRRVTDKMPANFKNIGLIHLVLPNAKIIHCVRDPVATCLSCYQQNFKSGNGFSYELADLAQYYRGYRELMDHWRMVLPAGRIYDIRYEDLVADFEAQARHLVEYCGVQWNDACLSFHKAKRQVRTASVSQVRQPIYKSSVSNWHRYEKHLGPLLEGLGELVETGSTNDS